MRTGERRKAGSGCIRRYETGEGTRYAFVASYADLSTRKRKQKWERGHLTERSAEKALREFADLADRVARAYAMEVERGEGIDVGQDEIFAGIRRRLQVASDIELPGLPPVGQLGDGTVGGWLAHWLDVHGRQLSPSTASSYRKNVRLHLTPYLGTVPLRSLTPAMLARHWQALEATGRADGRPGGLSNRTVKYVATILGAALDAAVEDGLMPSNPAKAKSAAPPARQADGHDLCEYHPWTADELSTFLAWAEAEDDGLLIAWRLLAFTGMRRGEVLGLQWRDVDLEGARLSVRRSVGVVRTFGQQEVPIVKGTKTGKDRVVDIDPGLVAALRAHKAALVETFGLRAGMPDEPVLPDPRASGAHRYRHSERFSREWRRRMARCEQVPTIRLHDLRHTHATLLIAAGVPVKVVSERLGHTSVMVTLTVYQHVVPGMQAEAAATFAALLGRAP